MRPASAEPGEVRLKADTTYRGCERHRGLRYNHGPNVVEHWLEVLKAKVPHR